MPFLKSGQNYKLKCRRLNKLEGNVSYKAGIVNFCTYYEVWFIVATWSALEDRSVTPVKAEEKSFRIVFCVGFWCLLWAISNSHQRTSTGWFWWQNSIFRFEYPKWYNRFWRRNCRKIVQQHLDYLAEVWSRVWVFFPTWSYNHCQILGEVLWTGSHILKTTKELP